MVAQCRRLNVPASISSSPGRKAQSGLDQLPSTASIVVVLVQVDVKQTTGFRRWRDSFTPALSSTHRAHWLFARDIMTIFPRAGNPRFVSASKPRRSPLSHPSAGILSLLDSIWHVILDSGMAVVDFLSYQIPHLQLSNSTWTS